MKKKSKESGSPVGNGLVPGSARERTIGSGELANLAGVSLRQLQWWDEQGVVRPRRIKGSNGRTRDYSGDQIASVVSLAKLRCVGISLQRCRKLIRYHASEVDRIVEAISLLRRVGLAVR